MGPTVAIIGAGFSGVMLSVHLLKNARVPLTIYLFERQEEFGRGVAYATRSKRHVLNVPSGNMSAFPNAPDHFLIWMKSRDPEATSGQFVSRGDYGAYLIDLLGEAESTAPLAKLVKVSESVTELHERQVVTASGQRHQVDAVVLAVGNFPPGHPCRVLPQPWSSRYIGNPWSADPQLLEGVGRVVLIGGGLTAVDLALLTDERSPKAEIHVVSRTGKLPAAFKPSPHQWEVRRNLSGLTARRLVRTVRDEIEDAASVGVSWESVLAALRPHVVSLWLAAPERERRRFLEHVRPVYERYRHRTPPPAWDLLKPLLESGRLTVHHGHALEVVADPASDKALVRLLSDGQTSELSADYAFNCSGPLADYRRMNDPLIEGLARQGLLRPDPLQLGVDATPDGRLLDVTGEVCSWLFTLGPPLKGVRWETTAVPEIRVQAEELAHQILQTLSSTS